MAAIEAVKYGLKVALIDKGRLGRSGSSPSGGGAHILVPHELGGSVYDNEKVFVKDIVEGGEYLNAQNLTEILAKEGIDRVLELENIGVPFAKTQNGRFSTIISLGESYPRGGMVKNHVKMHSSGMAILMEHLRKEIFHRGVKVFENIMITKLLTHNNTVTGALGIHTFTGDLFVFGSKATILAAGSATGLYEYASSNYLTTGDAYAIAYDIGEELMNMEFTEFTLIPAPEGKIVSVGGIKSFTSRGAKFFNAKGKELIKYSAGRITRGKLVQAVYKNIIEGLGPVSMDATNLSPSMPLHPAIHRIKALTGVDCLKERINIVPAIHTFLGGVRINEKCETNIPGLYAAGEAAGHGGLFGADRVGGAYGACFVFGQRAGRFASKYALKTKQLLIDERQVEDEKEKIKQISRREGNIQPSTLEKKIKKIAWKYISVLRNAEELKKAVRNFERIRREVLLDIHVRNTRELVIAIEVENLALTGEMIARAALTRKESRGQHQRRDYPKKNNKEWLKWIIIKKADEKMNLQTNPIPYDKYLLKQ